ncbi:MAG TPA: VC0807 family protein [Chloroflexota bacterium]
MTDPPPATAESPAAPPPRLKHWRAFGASEWNHVKDGAIGLALGSLLPVVLFYVSYQTFGFSVAVVIVLAWSALVFAWHFHRTRSADVFSATTFGMACVKAVAGLASQNTWLYLAWPSLENMIYGIAFFGSALIGKPLLALYAERLYPIDAEIRASTTFRRAFLVVSAVWLCGHTLRAVLRLWLLSLPLPLSVYLVLDTVAGWPINISMVAFTAWYPLRQLRAAGYMGVAPAPLSTMDAVELAVEESAPSTV